jgi:hypothetical protein
VAAILRESLPEALGQPPLPQWILRLDESEVLGGNPAQRAANLVVGADGSGPATVTLGWSGLATGRYLGIENYGDGTSAIGSTLVSIDNH